MRNNDNNSVPGKARLTIGTWISLIMMIGASVTFVWDKVDDARSKFNDLRIDHSITKEKVQAHEKRLDKLEKECNQ